MNFMTQGKKEGEDWPYIHRKAPWDLSQTFDSVGLQEISVINIFITVNNKWHVTKCRTETQMAKEPSMSLKEKEQVWVMGGIMDGDMRTPADDVILVHAIEAHTPNPGDAKPWLAFLPQMPSLALRYKNHPHFPHMRQFLKCQLLLWEKNADLSYTESFGFPSSPPLHLTHLCICLPLPGTLLFQTSS